MKYIFFIFTILDSYIIMVKINCTGEHTKELCYGKPFEFISYFLYGSPLP